MADLDDLAPDQRAVLQLVLGQGRDFDQLASLLKISPHAVRDRATAGSETLVPPPPGVNASERDAIVAYLLGAGGRPRDLSEEGRAWGDEVRDALAPLAPEELPELPGGPAATPAPKPARRAAAATPAAAPADEVDGDEDEDEDDDDDEPIAPRSLSRPPAERRSLLGGALLLAGVVIVVAVILVKVLGGSDDNKNPKPASATTPPTANTSAAATQTAQGNATTTTGASGVKVRAQVNLAAPGGGGKTAGIAQLVTQNTSAGFAVTAQGLTTVPKTYTGVWLTGSGVKPVLIAAVTNDQVKKGRFTGLTRAPAKLKSYTQMQLTREAITSSKKAPAAPSSSVIVQGALKVPADFTS
jgi:hypothetical protein